MGNESLFPLLRNLRPYCYILIFAVSACESAALSSQKIWKIQQWPQDWKRSVFIPVPHKGNAKECSNYHTIALISHASKVMLKILQARLQQYVNQDLPEAQGGLEKTEEPETKLPTSVGS